MVLPLGRPTVYGVVTGVLSTQGVLGPRKCLEAPVSGMASAGEGGTDVYILQANVVLIMLVPSCDHCGLLTVEPPMILADVARV